MAGDRPLIVVPQMCTTHRSLLVHQAGYGPNDTWRALVIASNIVLFQAATADPQTWARIDDVTKIGELGCLACYKPDAFGEVVEAAKSHDLGQIKALGERWLKESNSSGGSE